MNAIDCLNFPYHQSSKPHCQKYGRRNRSDNTCKNNRRGNNQRQQRLFPTELLPYSIVTPTNDNHFISKNIHSRNSSNKHQLIQVQPLNTINSDILKRVQQMIYLRENINNLTYREVHFSNQYIILKRLEEKNNFINQNRFKVDQYFRSLKLQYQTISTLSQNITITSFTYSKQDPLSTDRSLPTVIEMNDTITNESLLKQNDTSTIDDPIDSRQQYSQNATQSRRNINHLTKTKKQNLTFNTAVIIDVRKCPKLTTHRLPIQDNWNHIQPIWSRPIPNQSIYSDQYSRFMDTQQPPQIMFSPWSQNSNSTHQTNPVIDHPIYNENFFINNNTTSTNTIKKKTNQSIKYTQTLNKIKQILNTLEKNLLNKYHLSTQIDKTMTSDSLVTNYSISSTLPRLNNNYYSNRTKSRIKLLNSAKNINTNQQTSEDDDEINKILTSTRSQSIRSITVQYMSPSFMFILQILIVICLINRILM